MEGLQGPHFRVTSAPPQEASFPTVPSCILCWALLATPCSRLQALPSWLLRGLPSGPQVLGSQLPPSLVCREGALRDSRGEGRRSPQHQLVTGGLGHGWAGSRVGLAIGGPGLGWAGSRVGRVTGRLGLWWLHPQALEASSRQGLSWRPVL